jgi:type VI secretion system protein ImpE
VEALALEAQGRTQEAGELRARAWGDAPVLAAKVNGQPCESLVDADERIGPILEAYLDGRYYWIPFGQIQRLESEPAKVLIELVWLPSTLKLATGAEVKAYLPVRYPGSEEAADAGLRLARRTEWRRVPGGGYAGVGQRMFEHSQGDVPLLECRLIEFSPPAQADSASSTAGV